MITADEARKIANTQKNVYGNRIHYEASSGYNEVYMPVYLEYNRSDYTDEEYKEIAFTHMEWLISLGYKVEMTKTESTPFTYTMKISWW
jgi:hypothetical protein